MSDEETTTVTNLVDTGTTQDTPTVEKKAPEGEKQAVGIAQGKPTIPKNLTVKTSTPGKTQTAATPAVVTPADYVPNLKFKVLDQEKEFDEWLKPIVKSKEMEDKVRDLLTKAHGITKIKGERDGLRSEYDNFKSTIVKEYAPIVQNYNQLTKMASESRQSGDWSQFFHAAQIPIQSVIRWAADTVVQLEKNPNYLNQTASSWKTNSNLNNLQTENESLKQQMERVQMERQQVELDYTLKSPDVQTYAESFDTRMGNPGAFRNEIIRRGAMIEMTENRVATAQEIISELMKAYGGVPQAPSQNAMQGQMLTEGTSRAVTGSEGKPVLPNVKGRSGSPAKTVVKSTDDLRKIYAERAAG